MCTSYDIEHQSINFKTLIGIKYSRGAYGYRTVPITVAQRRYFLRHKHGFFLPPTKQPTPARHVLDDMLRLFRCCPCRAICVWFESNVRVLAPTRSTLRALEGARIQIDQYKKMPVVLLDNTDCKAGLIVSNIEWISILDHFFPTYRIEYYSRLDM